MAIDYANILGKLSVKISDISIEVEERLDFINDKLFQINTIDFCNPMGYILGKALPPDGIVQKQIDVYAGKLKGFTNKIGKINLKEEALNQLDKTAGTTAAQLQKRQETVNALLDVKKELDVLTVPQAFSDNIPGAEKITAKIEELRLKLTIAEGVILTEVSPLELLEQTRELRAINKFLLPFTNPGNVINSVFANQVQDVNKILRDFIRPDKFADDVEALIKGIVAINKLLEKIISTLRMVNAIIKLCQILIKLYIVLAKLLKKVPIPARWMTAGSIVKLATKANDMEFHKAQELKEFLGVISGFIDSVMLSIGFIRDEMLVLITNLEQLKQNLSACPYTKDNYLQEAIDEVIVNVNLTITELEEAAPQIKRTPIPNKSPLSKTNRKCHKLYRGFCIRIEKEVLVDENITVTRRYANIINAKGDIVDETSPTYATKDSIIINEAEYIINTYGDIAAPDGDVNEFSEANAEEVLDIDLKQLQDEENIAQKEVDNLVNNIQAEADLKKKLEEERRKKERQNNSNPIDQPDPKRVKKVVRFVNSITVRDWFEMMDSGRSGISSFGFFGRNQSITRAFNTYNKKQRKELLEDLGNSRLTDFINKNTRRYTRNPLSTTIRGYNRGSELRQDAYNTKFLIRFLKKKKFTNAEIQAGLEQTSLAKTYNFSINKKGKVRFKRVRGR